MEKKTITEIFLNNAGKFRDRHIISYKPDRAGSYVSFTWGELEEKAMTFASGIINEGFMPGDRLTIISFNRLEWIVTDLGTLLAGGVDVPVYHTNTPEQCAYIIKDSGAEIAVVENPEQLEKVLSKEDELSSVKKIILIEGEVPENSNKVISYASLMEKGKEKNDANRNEILDRSSRLKPADMATIVYTSGTTGPPKGCMVSHGNSSFVLWSIDEMQGIDSNSNSSLLVLPLSHFYPRISGYYFNLYKNIPMAIAESIETIVQNINEIRPTFFCCVPRILEKVYAGITKNVNQGSALKRKIFIWALSRGRIRSRILSAGKNLSFLQKLNFRIASMLVFNKIRNRLGGRLNFVVSAGAPLSAEVGEFIHSIGIRVIEFYGLTETLGGTMTTFEKFRFGTVGEAMPGFEVEIADDGEILIKGNNFSGYYNNPQKTAETICDGWCYTGDVGVWDDGFLKITDRKKDLIITSGGKNISPQNIENLIINSIPVVTNAFVYGDNKKYLTALITIDRDETIDIAEKNDIAYNSYEELIGNEEIIDLIQKGMDRVNTELASFETIKMFALLPREFSQEEGEITPTMKLKRRVIREKYSEVLESLYSENN